MRSVVVVLLATLAPLLAAEKPNVIVIMADDLGYGDISANGATALKTPNIDRLAAEGLRFTSGYCSASTCTPTRYSFLTGSYAFRRKGTGVAPPNGHLVIPPDTFTIADIAKLPATKPLSSANGTSVSVPKAKAPIGTASSRPVRASSASITISSCPPRTTASRRSTWRTTAC